jgi:Ca-activated chloride channel homolog
MARPASPKPAEEAPVAAAAPQASAPIVSQDMRARRQDSGATISAEAKVGGLADARARDEASASIQLKKAESNARYAKRLQDAADADLERIYLDERAEWKNSTAFYLDVADILFKRGKRELALRVLSNLAEMDLENRHILRILGQRLMEAEAPRIAIPVLQRVAELAPNEPQSFRDLGLAFAAAGQPQQAVNQLAEVVNRPWHGRFPEVELIALAELNAIAARAGNNVSLDKIDPRLRRNLSLDLRAVLGWDADNTDIDLWVTDPNGQKVYYGARESYQGGRMSQDFTGGYGPEEFSLKKAKPGKYKIEAQFYGHRQQVVAGATTLALTLSTGFGTELQKDQRITLRLQGAREMVYVGEFEVK